MAKKIQNVSRWGQDKARERYQFGGFTPPQANPAAMSAMANRPAMPTGLPTQAAPQAATALAARPAMPAQAIGGRPFKHGGKVGKAAGGSVKQPSPDINIRTYDEPAEGTDSYYARQEEKAGVPEKYRHYGDPVPAPPRRGRPLLKGK